MSTSAPSSTTKMVCSAWAEGAPSAVTTRQHAHLGAAGVHHGLDGEAHAHLEAGASASYAHVRDVRVLVHLAADAVAAEVGDDAAAGGAGDLDDGGADVADAGAPSSRGL